MKNGRFTLLFGAFFVISLVLRIFNMKINTHKHAGRLATTIA